MSYFEKPIPKQEIPQEPKKTGSNWVEPIKITKNDVPDVLIDLGLKTKAGEMYATCGRILKEKQDLFVAYSRIRLWTDEKRQLMDLLESNILYDEEMRAVLLDFINKAEPKILQKLEDVDSIVNQTGAALVAAEQEYKRCKQEYIEEVKRARAYKIELLNSIMDPLNTANEECSDLLFNTLPMIPIYYKSYDCDYIPEILNVLREQIDFCQALEQKASSREDNTNDRNSEEVL